MTTRYSPLIAILAAAFVAGCASRQETSRTEASTQAQAQQAQPQKQTMCPLAVPGVQVESAEAEGGAAIVYKTSEQGQVDELRKRVRMMAEAHNQRAQQGVPAVGEVPALAPARASVEDVDGGAKMVLTAIDPADAASVREHVQQRVAVMQKTGGCPMAAGGQCPMMGAQQGQGCPCPHMQAGQGCPCPHAQAGQCPCPHMQAGQCPHMQQGGCPHMKQQPQQPSQAPQQQPSQAPQQQPSQTPQQQPSQTPQQ
jgi:hypothetical protein